MGLPLPSPIMMVVLILACRDELVVECPDDQAEKVARFLEETMIAVPIVSIPHR